jgi:hypothetical protein
MTIGMRTQGKNFQGERALMGYVFLTALRDLRDEIECECVDIEDMAWGCAHAFRTARRFLLGTKPAWKDWRDLLCELLDQLPENIEAQALDVIKKRKRVA